MSVTTYQGVNKSSTAGLEENDYQAIYILCEVVGVGNIVITLYALICFITYGVKTKKFKFAGRKSDVNSGVVLLSATLAVALTLPRYISSQLIFNVLYIEEGTQWCEVMLDIANSCYFISGYAMYIFLWVRQKALYGHPAMKKLAGKRIQAFSWIVLFVLSAAAIAILLWFVIPEDYTHNAIGCVVRSSIASGSEDLSYQVYYLVLLGLFVIAQVSLLILFIYPMVRTNAIQNSRRVRSRATSKAKSNDKFSRASKIESCYNAVRSARRKLSTSSNGKSNIVQRTIRRSVACAMIAMVSDIVAMTLASFALSPNLPRSLNNTVYDIGLLISIFCVLETFTTDQHILKIFCRSASGQLEKSPTSTEDSRKYSEKFSALPTEITNADDKRAKSPKIASVYM